MENLRHMLAAVAALTLVLSVVSGANPGYFASFSAFADDDDDEDDKRGSSNDKGEIAVAFMENGKIKLEIDDELDDDGVTGELEIETEDGDLTDGEYAVSFSCTSPDFEEAFDESLEVDDGEGEFEAEISFSNGSTYEGCEVGIGELSVVLPSFKVQAEAEEEDDDDDDDRSNSGKSRDDDEEDDDDDNRGRGNNATSNGRDDDDDTEDDNEERGDREVRKMKLDVEGEGIEVEVELEDLTMADGSYDAIFSCTEPRVNMTFADAFEVDDGEGEFEAEIALANGTYSGCELEVEGTTIATFSSFTVEEEESDEDVEEKRKERRKEIISNISSEIRKRINANPASNGDYEPRLNYTLVANGTADYRVHDDDDDDDTPTNSTGTTNSTVVQEAEVELDIDMEVWKSNRALVLMNIFDGTVDIEGETYDVRIGYALYSVQHDVMSVNAFVTDDAGNVMKLKLRGHAVDEDAEFPAEEGDSIELDFEGNSGGPKNRLGNAWDLTLEGKVTAD